MWTNCSEKKDAMGMKLIKDGLLRVWRAVSCDPTLATNTEASRGWGNRGRETGMNRGVEACLLAVALAATAMAQEVSTTTVQGTVYLANGQPGAGTLVISWPAFTTAAGQAVAADSTTANLGAAGGTACQHGAGAGAGDAGGASGAGGEQGVSGPGDRGAGIGQWIVGDRRNADGAALPERRSDAAAAGRG